MNYRVYLSTKINPGKLERGSGIIVLEPEDYTLAQLEEIRNKGYNILAYLSVGSISTERSWYKKYSKYKLKRLPDWPKEFYMDLRKQEWRDFLVERAQMLKTMGFNGWWLDNIDVYSEYRSSAMFTAVADLLHSIKELNGYVMINGGSEWLDDAIDKGLDLSRYLNGYTQEEVFTLIRDYSGKGKFGVQKKADTRFYTDLIQKTIRKGLDGFLLEYTNDKILSANVQKWCSDNKASYYISDDVDL